MQIDYISDLHLDFHVPFNYNQLKWEARTRKYIVDLIENSKKGEAICIAGDISHYNRQSLWILEIFSRYYMQVFYTYGNHDMYLVSNSQAKKYNNHSMDRINELYDESIKLKNVHPLFTDETFTYRGVTFGGNPMWYPLETFEQQQFFKNVSNDSRLIKGVDMQSLHRKSMKNYQYLLTKDVDVMISHVPVIHLNSHKLYGGTSCYHTPISEIGAKHWVMGHSHERAIYKKAGFNFYLNCLGYPHDKLGEPSIATFNI